MTKFQYTGPAADYPTLGFSVTTTGAILDGTLSTPALTIPPDARWSVYGGGSAETGITRYGRGSITPTPETQDGYILAYSDAANKFVPIDPSARPTQTAENTPITFLRQPALTSGHAPFEMRFNSFSNDYAPGALGLPGAGTYNHAMHMGYNVGRHNGGAITAGAPGWFVGMEDRWPDIAGDQTTGPEMYLEYVSPDGTSVKSSDLRPLYFRLMNGWDNNPLNKSVTIQLDIGRGPNGSLSVWGGVQNGKQLLSVDQNQVLSYKPLNVLGNIQSSPTTGAAQLLVQSATGTNATARVVLGVNGAAKFFLEADQFGEVYLWDAINGRIHTNFISGGDAANSVLDVGASLKVQGKVGFYNTAPVTKPTGVAVTAAGIHAALVTLGLIAA